MESTHAALAWVGVVLLLGSGCASGAITDEASAPLAACSSAHAACSADDDCCTGTCAEGECAGETAIPTADAGENSDAAPSGSTPHATIDGSAEAAPAASPVDATAEAADDAAMVCVDYTYEKKTTSGSNMTIDVLECSNDAGASYDGYSLLAATVVKCPLPTAIHSCPPGP